MDAIVPRPRKHSLLFALASVVLVAVANWLEPLLAHSSFPPLELTPFGLAIAFSASLGGLPSGVLALVLSGLAIHRVAQAPLGEIAFLAGWMAFCLLAARLHRQRDAERQRCAAAQASTLLSSRLAQLTAALSHARTQAAAIEAALQEPLHALRADAGFVLLIDRDGAPATVPRAVGYTDAERIARESPTPNRKTPASVAIGRGAPVMIASKEAYAAEYGGLPLTTWSFEALAAVPLLVGSRVIAIVQLEFRKPRTFADDDREYLEVLASRGAQAIDRTCEYESALQARADAEALRERADQELAERQKIERALRASESRYRALAARTSRLHEMAAALSESATLKAVAGAVVQHGRNVLGAACGEVMLLGDGALDLLYSDAPGNTPSHLVLQPGLCATDAVGSRGPVCVSSFDEWQEKYSRSAALVADGGYVSSATLPLLVDAAAIGVISFHFTAPVNFDDEYRALLVSVAQHCAQAIDRARVYEAAQQARAEAEAANRMKDEFVSIVSHELRTPLNAIMGWTSLLQQGTLDEEAAKRALHSIGDNAARQLRLVQDLLDFSRLQAGRMALDVEDIELRSLLGGVVETILPAAAANHLHLDVPPVPAIKVRGDATRLEQVFLNLLGNAVKFTPPGGIVRVAVRQTDGSVEISVGDTGEGIDPTFLPHIFDAFRQAETSRSARHGGVGLGLSIAKELVEAHRGTIRAESGGHGCGATFIVSLPTFASAAHVAATVH